MILHLCTHVISIIDFGLFFPFYPSNSPKNENFKKKTKKPSGDTIILHNCTKSYDYRLYYSWDMVHDTCNFYFSFWAIFCPFTPDSPKNENLKKWKKRLEISSFYTIVPKVMIRGYIVPEIWCMTDVIVVFHFGLFFALLPL